MKHKLLLGLACVMMLPTIAMAAPTPVVTISRPFYGGPAGEGTHVCELPNPLNPSQPNQNIAQVGGACFWSYPNDDQFTIRVVPGTKLGANHKVGFTYLFLRPDNTLEGWAGHGCGSKTVVFGDTPPWAAHRRINIQIKSSGCGNPLDNIESGVYGTAATGTLSIEFRCAFSCHTGFESGYPR